jgi:hypothetical protein
MILPSLRCIPLTLLLLILGCIGSVQPSAAAFVRLAVFLHHFEQLLEELWFDSIKHILAVAYPQTPYDGINGTAFGHPRHRAVSFTIMCIYSCSDSFSPWIHMLTRSLFDLHALEDGQQLVAELRH